MKMIDAPSLNFDERPHGSQVEYLIFHYTAVDLATSLKYLQFSPEPNRVSAHYLICEHGTIYKLVDEQYRAWHAGVSTWGHDEMLNARSIGIELVNPGHGPDYRPFSEQQMQALEALSKDIISRYNISPYKILGHSDIAPVRKQDPGELFDWRRLAEKGIGIMPPENLGGINIDELELINLLEELGYRAQGKLNYDALCFIKRAFQQHYGGLDSHDMAARLSWLIQSKRQLSLNSSSIENLHAAKKLTV